jgi:hypothetical protein
MQLKAKTRSIVTFDADEAKINCIPFIENLRLKSKSASIKSIIEYGPLSLNQVFHFLIEIENGFQILKTFRVEFPVKEVNISSVTLIFNSSK